MTEKSFYNKLLELNSNWEIDSIEIDDKECKVEVTIKYVNNAMLAFALLV